MEGDGGDDIFETQSVGERHLAEPHERVLHHFARGHTRLRFPQDVLLGQQASGIEQLGVFQRKRRSAASGVEDHVHRLAVDFDSHDLHAPFRAERHLDRFGFFAVRPAEFHTAHRSCGGAVGRFAHGSRLRRIDGRGVKIDGLLFL